MVRRIAEPDLDVGSRLHLTGIDLVVRGMYEGSVDRVGLVVHDLQPGESPTQ